MNHPMLQEVRQSIEDAAKSKKFWEGVLTAAVSSVIAKLITSWLEKRRA